MPRTKAPAKAKAAAEPQVDALVDRALEHADEAPSGTDLVVRNPTDRLEVITVVDRHDEAQIVEELQRRALKVMLYSFPMDGAEVTDLSYLGINEAVRLMNNS